MKKFILFLCIVFSFTIGTATILAQANPPKATVKDVDTDAGKYELLSPIGNISSIPDVTTNGFQDYVNLLITIAIAIAGAITVVIIIVSGIQYMGTDSVWAKGESKAKMGSAVGGLALLLCSYLILYTINPELVNIKIGLTKINEGEWEYTEIVDYDASPTSATAECKGGIIKIPNTLNTKPGVDDNICKDLADKLLIVKTKMGSVDWVITATTNGNHISRCHKKGNAKTGACADIALRKNGNPVPADDPSWGTLCEAIHSIPELDFLNEASKTPKCEAIHKNVSTKYGTGPHLHVIYKN